MPSAEIITIGTELLLGEIVDTNARYIARKLRDSGIDLYRTTTVGDNSMRIAQAIQQALDRCEIIITTGGLGPTVDDPTREAVAAAVGVETEYMPELWQQIQARFQRFGRKPTENNKRQAYIPSGAIPVENPVGTAPSFIFERGGNSVIALPGVPREMEYLLKHDVLPYLRKRYNLTGTIKARVIHTAGMGESQIDSMIGDMETYSNPTIGLAAHSGQVDVRITAKAASEEQADQLIRPVEQEVRSRLTDAVYGVDDETLEGAALETLAKKRWKLAIIECGLGGGLIQRLSNASPGRQDDSNNIFQGGEVITCLKNPDDLERFLEEYHQTRQVEVCLAVAIHPGREKQDVHLTLITPERLQNYSRPYGGPPENAPRWAINHSLDILRRL